MKRSIKVRFVVHYINVTFRGTLNRVIFTFSHWLFNQSCDHCSFYCVWLRAKDPWMEATVLEQSKGEMRPTCPQRILDKDVLLKAVSQIPASCMKFTYEFKRKWDYPYSSRILIGRWILDWIMRIWTTRYASLNQKSNSEIEF